MIALITSLLILVLLKLLSRQRAAFGSFAEIGALLRSALRNLIQAKRRSFFLGLALGSVTMLLMLLLALSQGLSDTMLRSASTLMTGHINVSGWFKSKPTDAGPIVTDSAKLRKLVEDNVPGV